MMLDVHLNVIQQYDTQRSTNIVQQQPNIVGPANVAQQCCNV